MSDLSNVLTVKMRAVELAMDITSKTIGVSNERTYSDIDDILEVAKKISEFVRGK